MKYRFVFLSVGVVVVNASAAADQACERAQKTSKRNCAQAIQMASNGSPAGGPGSRGGEGISGDASQISKNLRTGIDAMTAATQYCEDQVNRCETLCKPGGQTSNSDLPERWRAENLTCIGGNCKNGVPTGPVVPCKEGSSECSPLVVQLGKQKLVMNPPSRGVWFDILGARAPASYEPVKISWPSRESLMDNYFLTLPKQSAMILGIDELFGNNTRGPDGVESFAANGFEALAKYDGRLGDGRFDSQARDRVIDRDDEVFSQLRLWQDRNSNGIAEYRELFSLDELGVKAIDLAYDPDFEETDIYGNRIKTKSVVRMSDDRMELIFDLWFVSSR